MLFIHASGVNYSWSNRRQGNRRIRSKIDIVVANEEWWRSFPNASIRMLLQTTSNHNPHILYCFGQNSFAKRPFRFEAMWTEDKRSYWVVNQAWQSMNHQFPPPPLSGFTSVFLLVGMPYGTGTRVSLVTSRPIFR